MQNNNLNSTADDSFFCPDFAEEDDKDNNADEDKEGEHTAAGNKPNTREEAETD